MMPILACLISFLLAACLVSLLGLGENTLSERHAAPHVAKATVLHGTAKHLASR